MIDSAEKIVRALANMTGVDNHVDKPYGFELSIYRPDRLKVGRIILRARRHVRSSQSPRCENCNKRKPQEKMLNATDCDLCDTCAKHLREEIGRTISRKRA